MPLAKHHAVGGPLVSLVLAVKNGMPFVAEALASVAARAYRPLEARYRLTAAAGGGTAAAGREERAG